MEALETSLCAVVLLMMSVQVMVVASTVERWMCEVVTELRWTKEAVAEEEGQRDDCWMTFLVVIVVFLMVCPAGISSEICT